MDSKQHPKRSASPTGKERIDKTDLRLCWAEDKIAFLTERTEAIEKGMEIDIKRLVTKIQELENTNTKTLHHVINGHNDALRCLHLKIDQLDQKVAESIEMIQKLDEVTGINMNLVYSKLHSHELLLKQETNLCIERSLSKPFLAHEQKSNNQNSAGTQTTLVPTITVNSAQASIDNHGRGHPIPVINSSNGGLSVSQGTRNVSTRPTDSQQLPIPADSVNCTVQSKDLGFDAARRGPVNTQNLAKENPKVGSDEVLLMHFSPPSEEHNRGPTLLRIEDLEVPTYSQVCDTSKYFSPNSTTCKSPDHTVHLENPTNTNTYEVSSADLRHDTRSPESRPQDLEPTQEDANQSNPASNIRKKLNALILSDSRMRDFNENKFCGYFNTKNIYTKTLKETQENFAQILSKSRIDIYVLNVGINDLKSESITTCYDRLCDLIDRLLMYTNGKICVSLILPTKTNQKLNDKVDALNFELKEHITHLRNKRGLRERISVVFNKAFFDTSENTNLFYKDWIHLSPNGLRIHCCSIKNALRNAFNIPVIRRIQADHNG